MPKITVHYLERDIILFKKSLMVSTMQEHMQNPLLGGITSVVGGISPLISKTLKDVVSNAKSTKKSIERSKPQKTQDIYS